MRILNKHVLVILLILVPMLSEGVVSIAPTAAHASINTPDNGWALTWGGEGYNLAYDMAIDSEDCILTVCSITGPTDLDPGPGIIEYNVEKLRTCLSKFDNAGNLLWARTWAPGSVGWNIFRLAVDDEGNIYVSGFFTYNIVFSDEPGNKIYNSSGGHDIFLCKFSVDGELLWVRTYGGPKNEVMEEITVWGKKVYLSGYAENPMDLGNGPVDSKTDRYDLFLVAYDSEGNYQWHRTGDLEVSGKTRGVKVDSDGDIYLTGSAFVPGDSYQSILFLQKMRSDGSPLWTRSLGGKGFDSSEGLAIDPDDDVFITGEIHESKANQDAGADFNESTVYQNGGTFLAKYDPDGNQVWMTARGEMMSACGTCVATSFPGAVVVGGYKWVYYDEKKRNVSHDTRYGGWGRDAYLCLYSTDGELQWQNTWGGPGFWDYCVATCMDSEGNIYVFGDFEFSVDFNPGTGEDLRTSNGNSDVFLMKFPPSGEM